MKKSKYSDTQIVSILKEAEAGQPVKETCRKYGISSACYYQWKSKFGGLSVSDGRPRGPRVRLFIASSLPTWSGSCHWSSTHLSPTSSAQSP